MREQGQRRSKIINSALDTYYIWLGLKRKIQAQKACQILRKTAGITDNQLNKMPIKEVKIDRRRKPILILECNSDQLVRENLSVGKELSIWLEAIFPRNRLTLVEVQTRAQLLEEFAALKELKHFYGDVIVIGHSNRCGLQINADEFIKWEAVGNWLELFEPQHLFLLACEAGRWLPCAALFEKLSDLKEIIGSPVPASKQEQYFILAAALHRLDAKKADPKLLTFLQAANFLQNKGVMFRQTRAEYKRGGQEQGAVWTEIGEPLIDRFVKLWRDGNSS